MKTRNEVTVGGVEYLDRELQGWTREQLQPITRQHVIESGLNISRSWLWTKGRDVHFGLLFGDNGAQFLSKDGGMVNYLGEVMNGNGEGQQRFEAEQVSSPPPVSQANNGSDSLADVLANALKGKLSVGIDPEAIKAQVDERVDQYLKGQTHRFEIVQLDGTKLQTDVTHKQLGELLMMISIRQHCALIGPAASGKTHACKQAADALGLTYHAPMSVGEQTSKSEIMGYMNAMGVYVETAFYRACKFGGLILLDEFDAGNPNVGTCINAATSNSHVGFPNGELVAVHPDFVVVLAMNTYGRGADRTYVGRNELDGATADRFAFITWDYDEALETAICVARGYDLEWAKYVQKVRKAVAELKLRYLVTSRAVYGGGKALQAGMSRVQVESMFVWKGMPETERQKVASKLN